jgi:hypothetical protein
VVTKLLGRIAAVSLLALVSSSAFGQYTTVTGTITDPNGTPYAACSINASFVGEAGAGAGPYLLGGTSTFQTSVSGVQCDSSGSFTLRLADNTQVQPTPSQWVFYVCNSTGKSCFNYTATISGASESISSGISAASIAIAGVSSLPTFCSGSNGVITCKGFTATGDPELTLADQPAGCTVSGAGQLKLCSVSGVPQFSYNGGAYVPFSTGGSSISWPLSGAADTSGAPDYSWSGDTGTGFFHSSAGVIGFSGAITGTGGITAGSYTATGNFSTSSGTYTGAQFNVSNSGGYQGNAFTQSVQFCGGTCTGSTNGAGGDALAHGTDNSSTGTSAVGGASWLRGGMLTAATPSASASMGPVGMAAGYLKGSAIAAQGDVVCGTTTAFTVTDCAITPQVNIIGIALTTANPVVVATNGLAPVSLSNTATVGDTVCMGTTTAGKAVDSGGQAACATAAATIGVVVAVAGKGNYPTGSGATVTTITYTTSLPLVQLHIW